MSAVSKVAIHFYFDTLSPFSYFAHKVLKRYCVLFNHIHILGGIPLSNMFCLGSYTRFLILSATQVQGYMADRN